MFVDFTHSKPEPKTDYTSVSIPETTDEDEAVLKIIVDSIINKNSVLNTENDHLLRIIRTILGYAAILFNMGNKIPHVKFDENISNFVFDDKSLDNNGYIVCFCYIIFRAIRLISSIRYYRDTNTEAAAISNDNKYPEFVINFCYCIIETYAYEIYELQTKLHVAPETLLTKEKYIHKIKDGISGLDKLKKIANEHIFVVSTNAQPTTVGGTVKRTRRYKRINKKKKKTARTQCMHRRKNGKKVMYSRRKSR